MNRRNDLKRKFSEVEHAYHAAKTRFDNATTAQSAAEAGTRLSKIEEKYWVLRRLIERIEVAEDASEKEIDAALGLPPAPQKTVPMLRLPMLLTTPEERKAFLRKADKRATEPDDLSEDQRSRYTAITDEYWNDSFAYIEGLLEFADEATNKSCRETGQGENGSNWPVAFTQGRATGIVVALARLWTQSHAATKFNREQRLLLEQRVTALEARPVFEDAGVWATDKGYRNGNGVTADGSYWIAKRDTSPGERPGACDGFRLAVKRGRDGRNAA